MPLKNINAELKRVVSRVKSAQSQLQAMIQDGTWAEQARNYAERQGDEVKKLINSDVSKIKKFIDREKKELEKLQKQLPSEVEKLRAFVTEQKKELRQLLNTVRGSKPGKARATKKATRKSAKKSPKKRTSKKASSSSVSSS